MKFFSPRKTTVENLAFIGIASALVALIALASSFSLIASIALMLVLPLLSSFVAMVCKNKFIPLYLLTAILLSTLLSFASFQNEILFVVPSLLLGVIYGLLEKSKCPRPLSLFICVLLEFGLFYLGVIAIRFFYEIDMVHLLLSLVGRSESLAAKIIFPTFVLAYSYAQIAITHLVFVFVFSRFKLATKRDPISSWYWAIGVGLYALSIIFAFFFKEGAYVLFGLSVYWTGFALIRFFKKPTPIPIVLMIFGVFLTWILSAALFKHMPEYTGLILYGVAFVFINISTFLNDILLRKKKGSTINHDERA